MKHSRMRAASFAAVLRPFAVLSPLAGIAAWLAGPFPARGADVPFTERVISTTAQSATSVFATDLDGDGDTDGKMVESSKQCPEALEFLGQVGFLDTCLGIPDSAGRQFSG